MWATAWPSILLSHAGGESGSADTVRDPRGFAVKFYTEDGNWDLVGNNTPIFFIRDPLLVSRKVVHAVCGGEGVVCVCVWCVYTCVRVVVGGVCVSNVCCDMCYLHT